MIFGGKIFGTSGSGSGEGGTTDHSKLINRHMPNQHPIEAITGLKDKLATGVYIDSDVKYIEIDIK